MAFFIKFLASVVVVVAAFNVALLFGVSLTWASVATLVVTWLCGYVAGGSK